MGPLIHSPSGALQRGLKELYTGESWAVLPEQDEHNPGLYSPGVKWNVSAGNPTHLTELFGPVLGVMRARNLDDAIDLVHQTGYGLTSGLESLDDREQEQWTDEVKAGNLYVNRSTTGAVVLRQPFGGTGKSAFGPGIKAGGPNYVAQLMHFAPSAPNAGNQPHGTKARGKQTASESPPNQATPIQDPLLEDFRDSLRDREMGIRQLPEADVFVPELLVALENYQFWVRKEFGKQHDHFRLVGQDNLRRYRPVRELRVRIHPSDTCFDTIARICAARAVGCRITVSSPIDGVPKIVEILETLTESWAGAIEFVEESDTQLAEIIRTHETDRLRYAAPERVPLQIFQAVEDTGCYIARAPVLAQGRIELLWYVQEQSVCIDYHRYGNLGSRSSEKLAEVL